MDQNDDQRLYTQDEIVEVLTGLFQLYNFQPWYLKPFWKKWRDALSVAILVFSGKRILDKLEYQKAVKDLDDLIAH